MEVGLSDTKEKVENMSGYGLVPQTFILEIIND